jgi:hypothetical protein
LTFPAGPTSQELDEIPIPDLSIFFVLVQTIDKEAETMIVPLVWQRDQYRCYKARHSLLLGKGIV